MMPDSITAGLSLSLAARLIPSAFLKVGRSLWEKDVIQRATKQLEIQFPTMRRGLRETVKNWISDDGVIDAVRTTKVGGARAEVTEAVVDAFLHHSTIPSLTREAAERFIAAFWSALEQEASIEKTGPWRQENISRHEAKLIREEIRNEGQKTRALIEAQQPLLQTDIEPQGEDGHWDQRIDDANRFLKERKMHSALASYEQILDDSSERPCPPRIRYRLHANIGICHIALGDWQKACLHFLQASDIAPEEPLPHWQLGQIRLHDGDIDAAIGHAEAAIAQDNTNPHSWLVKAQAEPTLDFDSLPTVIRETPEFWIVKAHRAFDEEQYTQVEEFAREALRRSHRSPEQLVDVSELLCLAYDGLPVSQVPTTIRNDIVRLTSEAIEKFEYNEYPSLAVRTLTLRGTALIDEKPDAAYDDFVVAARLEPEGIGPKVGQADVLIRAKDYSGALFVLRAVPVDCGDVRVHALRARIMVRMDPTNPEIEAEILRGMRAVETGMGPPGFLLDLADIATRAELVGIANRIVSRVDMESAPAGLSVIQARMAVSEGEFELAEQAYGAASARAAAGERRDILVEFAGFLSSRSLHGRAAVALAKADTIDGPDRIRKFFAFELSQAGQWTQLQELLDRVRSEGDLPDWALDAASVLALRRDDLGGARAYLTEMLSRGVDSASVSIRLAYALLRMGEPEEATSILDLLLDKEHLSDSTYVDAAKLYFRAGRYEAAIRTAYIGWRRHPFHPELESILLSISLQVPDDLPITADMDIVAADTWVRLEDVRGATEVSYFITSDEAIPGRSQEVSANSPTAALLIGKRINDTVVLQPRGIDPVTYRVRQIRTAVAQTIHEALQRVGTRVDADQGIIQSVRIDTPDSVRFLAPILSTLYQSQTAREWAIALYHERRLPLALFSKLAGVSIRTAYEHLTSTREELLHTELGSPNSLRNALLAAKSAHEIIISATALFTLRKLNLLPFLTEIYNRIFSPPSLVELLQQDRLALAHDIERGTATRIGLDPAGILVHDVPRDELQREMETLDAMIDFLDKHTSAINRPLDSLEGDLQEVRKGLGDAEMDALVTATTDRPLLSDDQGIRTIAESHFGASTFSTVSFLHVAEERGLLTRERRLLTTVSLIEAGHSFVPISAELLFAALCEDGMVLGSNLTTVLPRLTEEADPRSSLPVAVGFLREVAAHPLARGAFRGSVWALLDIFCRVPDQGETLRMFDTLTAKSLRLLPVAYDSYQAEREAFKLAKEMLR